MKLHNFRNKNLIPKFSLKNAWRALAVLLASLFLTFIAVYYTRNRVEEVVKQDFKFICNDFAINLNARLKAHAQLLRSGAAFFAASDTVTREEWRVFNETEKINRNLPGIDR